MRTNSGISLVEILVVVATLGVLAAILFPVFSQSRTRSQFILAENNLNQVYLGIHLYAGDHDDSMPICTTESDRQYYRAQFGNYPNQNVQTLIASPDCPDLLHPWVKSRDVFISPFAKSRYSSSDFAKLKTSISFDEVSAVLVRKFSAIEAPDAHTLMYDVTVQYDKADFPPNIRIACKQSSGRLARAKWTVCMSNMMCATLFLPE